MTGIGRVAARQLSALRMAGSSVSGHSCHRIGKACVGRKLTPCLTIDRPGRQSTTHTYRTISGGAARCALAAGEPRRRYGRANGERYSLCLSCAGRHHFTSDVQQALTKTIPADGSAGSPIVRSDCEAPCYPRALVHGRPASWPSEESDCVSGAPWAAASPLRANARDLQGRRWRSCRSPLSQPSSSLSCHAKAAGAVRTSAVRPSCDVAFDALPSAALSGIVGCFSNWAYSGRGRSTRKCDARLRLAAPSQSCASSFVWQPPSG